MVAEDTKCFMLLDESKIPSKNLNKVYFRLSTNLSQTRDFSNFQTKNINFTALKSVWLSKGKINTGRNTKTNRKYWAV